MYTIPMSTIRAILPTIPKKDVRFYLVGALIDLDAGRIVVTDGHRMVVCEGPKGTGRHIIPRDALAMIAKVKAHEVSVEFGPMAGAFTLRAAGQSVAGNVVDGTYPDYARIIPRQYSGQAAQYNADYLADAQAALATFFDLNMTKTPARMEHNGLVSGVMHVNKPGCFVVIMPTRADDRMDRDMAAFIGCVTDAPTAAAA